jgi:competence protein ComEC
VSRSAGPLVDHDRRPDLRLVVPALATWGGAFTALVVEPLVAFTAAVALMVAGIVISQRRSVVLQVLAVGLLLAAGAAGSAGLRVQAMAEGPVPALAADRAFVTATVTVTSDPERLTPRARGPTQGAEMVMLRARVESVAARGRATHVRTPVLVLSDERWLPLVPGSRVTAHGRLGLPRATGPISAVLAVDEGPQVVAGPGVVQRIAERCRGGLRQAVAGLPPAERGLVPGLVVGDTSGIPGEVDDDLRKAGLTHLTAVSGANLAILLAAVLGTARWAGLPVRATPLVGLSAVVGFVVLARPQPSVLRAAVMGLVALVALASGRERRALPALCAAVIALVVVDPWLARSYGFALSVLATAGLVVLAPGWRAALAQRLPAVVADVLSVSVAAQVACAPVVVLLAGELSLVAVPANILVAPAVAPATLVGVLAAVTALATPGMAAALGWLAGVPAWWIVEIAERAARLPGATLGWPAGLTGSALLAVALVALLVVLPIMLPRRIVLAATAVSTILLVAPPPGIAPKWPPDGWLLVACDVGQGDALVLNAGHATAVAIDTGPDPRLVDGCLRSLGVRRLPLVILTHFHADHVTGLPGALRGRTVGEIEVSPLDEPYGQAERVHRWAAENGVRVTTAVAGEQRSIGPWRWQVLWPRGPLPAEGSAPNNASVVVYAQLDSVGFLLAGDVEPAAQRSLRRLLPVGAVDVLKVAHHGSRLQDPGLLTALRPRLAMVSVGVDNDYGHPAAATLALLARGGARVVRTDHDGDIAVVESHSGLDVVLRGPPSNRDVRSLPGPIWPRAPPCIVRPYRWMEHAALASCRG